MMTLAYLRSVGIRCVSLDCECGWTDEVNVDALPDASGVPDARLSF